VTEYKKRPLGGPAWEYLDLDLKSMSKQEIMDWGKNIVKDNVVLVRNQDLSETELLRVLESIGRVLKTYEFFNEVNYPGLGRVTNRRDQNGKKIGIFADNDLGWHSNGNARESGRECCVSLYCVSPGEPGPYYNATEFCDTRQAYQDLPDEIKEIVDDVDCNFQWRNNTFYHLEEGDPELPMFENPEKFPEGLVKPLVYTHPFSGEKGLYFTFHYITNMWRRGGKPLDQAWLRKYLMDHVFNGQRNYVHNTWQKGDLILMDQFHSLHRRNEVRGDRFLYRTTLDYSKSLSRRAQSRAALELEEQTHAGTAHTQES
jgi:alpha-ketoglutarate-dependent taurine dioxygenase